MQWKQPKNNDKYQWTQHSLFKMQFYGLSVQKVLGVIKKPERKEGGIAKNTIAVMQPINPKVQKGKKVWKQEVWVMYRTKVESRKSKVESDLIPTLSLKKRGGVKIISAWRYPGISPQKNPIPSKILAEIGSII